MDLKGTFNIVRCIQTVGERRMRLGSAGEVGSLSESLDIALAGVHAELCVLLSSAVRRWRLHKGTGHSAFRVSSNC